MKSFIFLYPISEIIDYEIQNNGNHYPGGINAFKQEYKRVLNKSINERYRQDNFKINYVLFSDTRISDVVEIHNRDNIIELGLTFKEHTEKKIYPNQNSILDSIGNIKGLIISGFHMWDCVERLAKRAHEKGIETLVDEDLTEFLSFRLRDKNFRTDVYPTCHPEKGTTVFRMFMEARKNKPWLWQEY